MQLLDEKSSKPIVTDIYYMKNKSLPLSGIMFILKEKYIKLNWWIPVDGNREGEMGLYFS